MKAVPKQYTYDPSFSNTVVRSYQIQRNSLENFNEAYSTQCVKRKSGHLAIEPLDDFVDNYDGLGMKKFDSSSENYF